MRNDKRESFLTLSAFKSTLTKIKESLDATKDPKYITAIDGLIARLKSLEDKQKSLKPEQILSETEIIERDLGTLRGTIAQEISNL